MINPNLKLNWQPAYHPDGKDYAFVANVTLTSNGKIVKLLSLHYIKDGGHKPHWKVMMLNTVAEPIYLSVEEHDKAKEIAETQLTNFFHDLYDNLKKRPIQTAFQGATKF